MDNVRMRIVIIIVATIFDLIMRININCINQSIINYEFEKELG